MVENLNTLYKNETRRVDSPTNEDSKNIIFSREALISEDGQKI